MDSNNLLISSSLGVNLIFIFILFIFPILSFNNFIFLILFSMLIQLFIKSGILLLFQLFSISFPFSNDIFILFGNLSHSFIIFSSKYNSLYLLSTSNNNSSSLFFNAPPNLVNIF